MGCVLPLSLQEIMRKAAHSTGVVMVQSECTLTEIGERNARALYGSKVNNVLAF